MLHCLESCWNSEEKKVRLHTEELNKLRREKEKKKEVILHIPYKKLQ